MSDAWIRRHAGFLSVLSLALVLRVLVMVAYPRAFLYTDSVRYLEYSHGWQPDFVRQAGYSMFLKVLRHTGSVYAVSAVQHLLGLGVGVAVYAVLRRRGVPAWLAVLATTPVLFDGFQLGLEHYLLAETLFTALIIAGLVLLVWSVEPWVSSKNSPATGGRSPGSGPGPVVAAVAGLLLAASVTVRVVALPLVILSCGYLVVRRAGWRPVVAFAGCAAAPLLGYVVWFHHYHGSYNFSTFQGVFLYGRTAPVADCEHLTLTPGERALCPWQPVGVRPERPDWYIWSPDSPGRAGVGDDEYTFAIAVFTQQPATMAREIAKDTGKYLYPTPTDPDWLCAQEGLLLPADPPIVDYDWCKPNPRQTFSVTANPATMPRSTPLTHFLGGYAHLVQTPRLVLGGSVLLALLACVWRPRRRGDSWAVPEIILWGGWGLGLLVLSVSASLFDERYGLPSVAILPACGVMAGHRLWRARTHARPELPVQGLRATPPT